MESLAIIVASLLHQGEDCNVISSVCYNWVSEANPTLGCSIEISRDIYICQYVCRFVYGKPIQKIACQNAWEELRGPNMRMLKVSFGWLKPTCDTHIIHVYYMLEQL